jgi:hypothetical protein
MKKWFLECRLSVPVSVYVDVCPSSVWTIGPILFIFGICKFIRHRSVLSEYERSGSNTSNKGRLDRYPKTKMENFSKVSPTILIKFK